MIPFAPISDAIDGIGIPEQIGNDKVEEVCRVHGPARLDAVIVAGNARRQREQFECRDDLQGTESQTKSGAGEARPQDPAGRLPSIHGLKYVQHPEPCQQQSDTLKHQGFE